MPGIMNNGPLSPAALDKALEERLTALLREIPWLREVRVLRNPAEFDRAFDLLASFKIPCGPEIELWVDVRSAPRPAQFPYVSMQREFDQGTTKKLKVRVFAAPHISSRMAEICGKHGWSWFDLSGNCRISIPNLLHLHHTGNPPVHPKPKPRANLGTREAGRVVRALLTPLFVGRTWTQRSLRTACQPEVSLGLVNKLVQHLQEERFLEPLPDGGFLLSDPLKLLFAWRDAYRFDQHERLGHFTLLQGSKLQEALVSLDPLSGDSAAYAAFSAADFQAPHVRQPKTWLYVSSHFLDHFREVAEAKPVDSGENLVVLVPYDAGVFFSPEITAEDDHLPCTNPVQTYVDLWHSGGRGREAAEALLEQRLKPVWRAAGYEV